MVDLGLFPSSQTSDQTLDVVWRSTAYHLPTSGILTCVILGLTDVVWSILASHPLLIATVGATVSAYGCYAAAIQPTLGGRWLGPRTQRVVAKLTSGIAAGAALASGLLILAAVFGGSIGVMRD